MNSEREMGVAGEGVFGLGKVKIFDTKNTGIKKKRKRK